MTGRESSYAGAVEARYPGLMAQVRDVIQESEKRHEGVTGHFESYLWEHTTHVASYAYRLAQAEELDPLVSAIAALFHDAGKFAGGRYHAGETIEEEESVRIAERLTRRFGVKSAEVTCILNGLKALYREGSRKNAIADIIHDADFLAKFGALGVAAFFVKSTLRGRTLQSAIAGYLSKELTYAACLPANMHTAAGRILAGKKAADSLKFFRSLLAELREAQIMDLRIRRVLIPHPGRKNQSLKVQLIAPRFCPQCGGLWHMAWATERGVKCRKLIAEWVCRSCGGHLNTAFCLPEISV